MSEITPTPSGPDEPPVGWRDRIALQIWLCGAVLLWILPLANLLSYLWPR